MTVIIGCSSSGRINESNYHLSTTPPNGIKVSETLFCDQTEIDNLGWLEYMYWTHKVYGPSSFEYFSAFPDTRVWEHVDTCFNSYVEYYLKHPSFRNYPVVGITQKQAADYTKWRSDRVFEVILIQLKKIKADTAQTRETYFSIERYFNGGLNNIVPGEKLMYYPEFRLPTICEREMILQYADSVDKAYFDNCKSKYCKECNKSYPHFRSDIVPCLGDSVVIIPTTNVYDNCSSKKDYPIYNLRGNVSEWTSEIDIAVGGGWHDTRTRILEKDTSQIYTPNAWTGFRNVCEWKKW